MKNVSDLELSELLTMMSRVNDEVNTNFSHVVDKMSKKLRKDMKEYYDFLCKEQEERENSID